MLKEFELTEEDVTEMMDILSLPVMCVAGRWPHDILKMKWREVAKRLGCVAETIEGPIDGNVRRFKAEPLDPGK